MFLVINDTNDFNLSRITKSRQGIRVPYANVRALVYVSDQQTVIIDSAIMHRVNHPQLQFHINDNYIVEIYVSMMHYPVIYGIDLAQGK